MSNNFHYSFQSKYSREYMINGVKNVFKLRIYQKPVKSKNNGVDADQDENGFIEYLRRCDLEH